MKSLKNTALFTVALCILISSSSLASSSGDAEAEKAWLEMPKILERIVPPVFPQLDFSIAPYGAVEGGKVDCTKAFAAAIKACADAGGGREGMEAFLHDRLFGPAGMHSAIPKFDEAGTFIGSSFVYATARDFARFGLLYLRDGVWDGRRLLPEGWVDYARTPTPQPIDAERRYGAHWWLDLGGKGAFSANGHEGQYTVLVPELDLIVVRHGKTSTELKTELQTWIDDLVDLFRR